MKDVGALDRKKAARSRIKAIRKLSKRRKKGRLPTHVNEQIKSIKNQRDAKRNQELQMVHDDWILDRQTKEKDEDVSDHEANNSVPSPDLDLESSDDEPSCHDKIRSFGLKEELLPIKLNGRILRQLKSKKTEEEESQIQSDEDEMDVTEQQSDEHDDASTELSVEELEKKIIATNRILLSDPQTNVLKLNEFFKFAQYSAPDADTIHSSLSIRELAIVSLTEIFINIAPGYSIRVLTTDEKQQKMKKDTRQLVSFEQNVLTFYTKFIKILQKNVAGIIKVNSDKKNTDGNIPLRMGILSYRCMCKLLQNLCHFNQAEELVESLIRLTVANDKQITTEICDDISSVLKSDYEFKTSLMVVKSIAQFSNAKKFYVPSELLQTLLSLNIREVEKAESKNSHKIKLEQKRKRIHMERKSKSTRKFEKQVRKLDAELKEALEKESSNRKLKFATETMKHVFLTYFRVLKRMPSSALLAPVLEGLNKFVHLISVEFFDDLILLMGRLIEQTTLSLTETLHCIRTTYIILSGEGQVLNIDLNKFSRKLYAVLPRLCFEMDETVLEKQLGLLIDCIDVLLIKNRKNVSPNRVAAFIKRLILITFTLSARCTVAILALSRRLFIAHPNLRVIFDKDEELIGSVYRPDCVDPDHCSVLSISLKVELFHLSRHPDNLVRTFAKGMSPETNAQRIDGIYVAKEPKEWLEGSNSDSKRNYFARIKKFHKLPLNSTHICSVVTGFIESATSNHNH